MKHGASLAERKSLLVAQADLHRLQIAFGWRDARAIVTPQPSPERSAWARPKVIRLLGVALPLLGARRLGRMVRMLSVGMMAYRALRNWRTA